MISTSPHPGPQAAALCAVLACWRLKLAFISVKAARFEGSVITQKTHFQCFAGACPWAAGIVADSLAQARCALASSCSDESTEAQSWTQHVQQRPCSAGGGGTTQFGGPIAAALFVLWLALAFFGWILALAGLSALQNKIYKESNALGAAPHVARTACAEQHTDTEGRSSQSTF